MYQNGGLINYNDCPLIDARNFGLMINQEKIQKSINFLTEYLKPLSFKDDSYSDKHWNGFNYDKNGNLIERDDSISSICLGYERVFIIPGVSKKIKVCYEGETK